MIRSLAPNELPWFLSRAYTFLGHSDPSRFALKQIKRIKDAEADADQTFILIEAGEAVAGVHVRAAHEAEDDKNLMLVNIWYEADSKQLERLLRQVFARYRYEAVHFPLFNYSAAHIAAMRSSFEVLGFNLENACDLRFELSELPPLGLPLVLEAWTYKSDEAFEEVYTLAEELELSEAYWAWLKRWRGSFEPDLWFIGRETLDQEPIGYGFFGSHRKGIDGVYYLTAIGALPDHRHSSEMLRRLVLSCLRELASLSPLGRIETTLPMRDPKLVNIFESLGFDVTNRYKLFIKRPK